ncbi:MAG: SpoIIE family protein phosphatase, partial [Eubacterium sp.]|nr:SpoIIE family protein phosphatase [Eubacterium sp.]
MRRKKQRKLSIVLLVRLMLLSIVLVSVINIVVAHVVKRETLDIYKDFAFSYTNTVAGNIDPNVIEEYRKSGKTDDYYEAVKALLLGMVHGAGLRYLYVFVPEKEGIRYVWDAQLDDDSRPLNDIWYYDGNYPEEEAMNAYREGVECFTTYNYGDLDLAAAISPLKNSDGETVALIETDILMPRIRSSMWKITAFVSIGVLIVMAIAMALFYFFARKRVVVQLMKIKTAAEEMVANLDKEERASIDVHTNDELEAVARAFEEMDQKLLDYIDENEQIMVEKERVNTELTLATKIQADMLPNIFPAFPDRPEFNIYADMTPAKEVGGDFYDFFFTDPDHLAIVMADVSGKGIPAAMFMMMAKSMIQSQAITGNKPSQVLSEVNNIICSNNREDMFVTVWFGVFDVTTGVIIAANAGHENPILYHEGGEFEVMDDPHGFVIGGKQGMKYHDYKIKLEKGSKLFIYTDGVPEATNADLELFGMDRTLEALNSVKEGGAEDVLMAVDRDVYKFVQKAEQFDDLTMLCLEYYGVDPDAPRRRRLPKKELTLEAKVDNIDEVTELVERELVRLACPEEVLGQINVAIDEVFGNISNYAYENGDGYATIRLETDEEKPEVILTFLDAGMPFNPVL